MPRIDLVSVVLPTYNEVENIVPLARAIHAALSSYAHEVIVVDDNSPDGTSQATQMEIDAGNSSWLRLETRTKDRGLTNSIWRGIELAKGDTVVWMDCDFSMPPEVIPHLLAKVEEGKDIAVGSRFVAEGKQKGGLTGDENESPLAIVLSSMLNMILPLLLLRNFHDFTSGFIAIRRDVFNTLKLRGDYGEYFMDLIVRAHLQGRTWIELPYVCGPRAAGESKTAPNFTTLVKRGVKYLAMIVRLWFVRIKKMCGGSIADSNVLA